MTNPEKASRKKPVKAENTEAAKVPETSVLGQFFTRDKANEGIKLPLYLPTGGKSEHVLTILGIDSDVFRTAETNAQRKAIQIAQIEDVAEREAAIERAKVELVAVLVVGWTFDIPCTPENVINFLINAPQIRDAVDRAASKRALFFNLGQAN